jgi:hypothetical protein
MLASGDGNTSGGAVTINFGKLFEDGELPSNGEDLSSDNKMSKASNYDNKCGSGGGVRDRRGDNGRTSTSSSGSLTLASRDGITSKGALTIDGGKQFDNGEPPSNGDTLSGNNKMSEDSNNDKNGCSGGGVRDKRGHNERTSTSSGRSLTLALGDGNTS